MHICTVSNSMSMKERFQQLGQIKVAVLGQLPLGMPNLQVLSEALLQVLEDVAHQIERPSHEYLGQRDNDISVQNLFQTHPKGTGGFTDYQA